MKRKNVSCLITSFLVVSLLVAIGIEYSHSIVDFLSSVFASVPHFLMTYIKVLAIGLILVSIVCSQIFFFRLWHE